MKIVIALCLLGLAFAQDCSNLSNCNSCTNPGIICEDCDDGKILNSDSSACLSCSTNCMTCTANADDISTTCTACIDGTYLDASGECVACQEGCTACALNGDGDVECSECTAEGYVMDPTDLIGTPCVACENNCKTCTLAEGVTTCTACFTYPGEDRQGYFLRTSDKSCKTCGSRANVCSDDGSGSASITGCYSGYEVQSSDNSRCLQCPTECDSCEGTELNGKATCTACKDDLGNFLVDGECISCGDNCLECEDESNCADCETGYRVDGGSCTPCPSNCDECSVDDETGDDVCDECKTNFGEKPTTSVSCDRCTLSNCKDCTISSSTGEHSCTTCNDGYAKNSDGACIACPTGCTTCDWRTDFMGCTVCGPGYGGPFPLTADQAADNLPVCTACSTLDSQCTTCSAAASSECSECGTGYWWDSTNTRCSQQAVTNCVSYTANENVCTACEDGYAVNGAGDTCDACTGSNCKLCATGTLGVCTDCAEGEKLYDSTGNGGDPNTCQDCGISRATDCTITDPNNDGNLVIYVTACEATYGVFDNRDSPSTSEGTSCRKCVDGCDTCTWDYTDGVNEGRCDSNGCSAKFANVGDGSCAECPENCDVCSWNSGDSAVECTQCATGYAVDGSNQCGECPENCNECELDSGTNSIVCKSNQCDTGYGLLSTGQCEACPANCDSCTPDDDDNMVACGTCADGYAENSLVCGACPSNCIECDDDSGTMECKTCKDRYALDSTTKECISCFANCDSCTSSNEVVKCTTCADGFSKAADSLSCSRCNVAAFDNCATCEDMVAGEDTAACTSCTTGFVLKDENEAGPCIDVTSLDCNQDDKIDPAPECTDCAANYAVNDDGECRVSCYTCGTFPGTGVAVSQCQIPSSNNTGASGVAEMKDCAADNNVCVVFRLSNGNVIAGCAPDPEFNDNVAYTCTEEKQSEFCPDTATAGRCEKCCIGNECNIYIAELDGTAFAMPTTSTNILLLCAALLFAIFRI